MVLNCPMDRVRTQEWVTLFRNKGKFLCKIRRKSGVWNGTRRFNRHIKVYMFFKWMEANLNIAAMTRKQKSINYIELNKRSTKNSKRIGNGD